jgi:DNA repair protein RecN (Recombination protein N)
MLHRLHIKNFALVQELSIEFAPGMNVLTGETGAGKSVIVGALAQILGERADKDDIRSGEKAALIEAEFDIGQSGIIAKLLSENGLEGDGRSLLIRKEIFASDRATRVFINDRQVAARTLKDITEHLAQLYGQHSHQQLIDEKNHLSFLDAFAGLLNDVEQLSSVHADWQSCEQRLKTAIRCKSESEKKRELMQFQKEEIENARIKAGEEEQLLAERKILDSAALLGQKCSSILNTLDGDENSILAGLGACSKELAHILPVDKKLESLGELMDNASVNLEEFRAGVESYLSSIPDDPVRLEEINLRLDEIYRLKKKYGGSEEAILKTLEEINVELGRMNNIGQEITYLQKQVAGYKKDYDQKATALSQKRQRAARKLSRMVKKELGDLAIGEAGFECEFLYVDDPDGIEYGGRILKAEPTGLENIRFLFSANPGEPLKPLSSTASGGEISRVMLALKTAEQSNRTESQPLLVFDEIDAGIGGLTAKTIAEKLSALGRDNQLMVITHLHQIATLADHHFAVEKVVSSDKSKRHIISVIKLDKKSRADEIRRMLSLDEMRLL